MIDPDLLRNQPERVEENLRRRRNERYVAIFVNAREVDAEWRDAVRQADQLRQRRNELSHRIAEARRGGTKVPELETEAADIPERLKRLAEKEAELEAERNRLLRGLPNLLDDSVPYGKDDSDNVVVATWGTAAPAKEGLRAHGELLEALGMAEFDRAHRVSGAGFYYLTGPVVLLDLALQRFALELLVERGFTPVEPPYFLRSGPYEDVTDLDDFKNVMYKIDGEDLFLIATSEHPLAALYRGEILDEDALPIKLAGISACFRKEIGGHGVDQKGIFRVHQFQKVEQFVFCRPEESAGIHEEIRANAEEVFRRLEIPYRVVNVCTGDLGTVAAKKYDIEAWFPRQQAFREVVSCSNCTEYQARRLRVRVGKAGKPGKIVPHTLNSTAVATSRAIAAILEQNQQPDGSVAVPKVLRPYLGGRDTLAPATRRP